MIYHYRVYGRLNGRGRQIYLETVDIEDFERLHKIKVYRTFRGDYVDLSFEEVMA